MPVEEVTLWVVVASSPEPVEEGISLVEAARSLVLEEEVT